MKNSSITATYSVALTQPCKCTDWIFLQKLLRPKYYRGFVNPESWGSSQIMKALKKYNGRKKPLTKETEYNIEKCLNKC